MTAATPSTHDTSRDFGPSEQLSVAPHLDTGPNSEADALAEQTDAPIDAPICPICHKSDQIRTIQAAFDTGLEEIAPPAMPENTARMAPWIIAGFAIYLAGNLYLFVELGRNETTGSTLLLIQVASFVLNLLALLAGLVLSFIAVLRVSRADTAVMERYPSWDRAMEVWNRLYYCLRDHIAIDSEENRALSDEQLRALISTEEQEPRRQRPLLTHGDIHPVAADQ